MRRLSINIMCLAAACLLLVSGLLLPSSARAFNGVNVATINRADNWNPISDVNAEVSIGKTQDISSNGAAGSTGSWPSVYVGSDQTAGGYVYFRTVLNCNPLEFKQGLWQVQQNAGVAAFLVTGANALNATTGTTQDWCVQLSKTATPGSFYLFQGTGTTPVQNVTLGTISVSDGGGINVAGSVWTDSTGYITITDTGTPNALGTGDNIVYVDMRAPLSWFTGVSLTTPIRAFYGTSTQTNTINKDYMIAGALDFTQSAIFTFGNTSANGFMYDTRDTAPPNGVSSAGTWYGNETLQVNGYGWPYSRALTVKIYDPSGSYTGMSGTVTSNANGNLTNAAVLTIPVTWTPGVYKIYVVSPVDGSTEYQYDTFTVAALPSTTTTVSKTVSLSQTPPNTEVTYTITINNTGADTAYVTSVTDTLPAGFTYVSGSTSGTLPATTDPGISGQVLTWTGSWAVNAGSSATLVFRAITSGSRGTYLNSVSVAGANFTTSSANDTAQVKVVDPQMTLSKGADKANVRPGDTLTYTLTYSNTGDGDAISVVFLDSIPPYMTYVTSSASGAGATIEYSHNGGGTWDGSDAAPVTDIKWTLNSPLAPAAGGTLSLSVTINQ